MACAVLPRSHHLHNPVPVSFHGAFQGNDSQGHGVPLVNTVPYLQNAQGVVTLRAGYAPSLQPAAIGAQRTSDGSSAGSGSLANEIPLTFQALNASTLCPPGDEHTNALLQSLMNVSAPPAPRVARNAYGQARNSNSAADAQGAHVTRVVAAANCSAVDDILAQVQAEAPAPVGGASNGVGRLNPVAIVIKAEDGSLLLTHGAAPVHTATTVPFGARDPIIPAWDNPRALKSPLATATAAAAAAAAARPSPPNQPPPNPFLAAANSLGIDPALLAALQMSDGSVRAPPPAAPQHPETRPAGASPLASGPAQQPHHHPGAPSWQHAPAGPVVRSAPQHGSEIRRDLVLELTGTMAGASGFDHPAAQNGRQNDEEMVAARGSRARRRVDVCMSAEQDSSSLKAAEDGSELQRASAGGPSRQHSGGLVARGAESARAGSQTPVPGVRGKRSSGQARSDSSGQDAAEGADKTGSGRERHDPSYPQGREDVDDEDDDGEGETSDGEDPTPRRQAKKRMTSQGRRGRLSVSSKKELCRERNRTAQRRFRERQKDLIRALQEQVEKQEAIIKELTSRLAVYEEKPKPAD